jgi:SAM-dependent methyltransferase
LHVALFQAKLVAMDKAKLLRQKTVDTYNKSAAPLSAYFRGIGPRHKYIDLAFKLAGNPANARVLEIGCGDGRDAKAIIERTPHYTGIDISTELIALARNHMPKAHFEVADAAIYKMTRSLDIIFAFASLLHLSKDEVADVLRRAHSALRPGGVFYISLKYRPKYVSEVRADQYGQRLFYFYSPELLAELAGSGYEVAASFHELRGKTDWIEIALRKR